MNWVYMSQELDGETAIIHVPESAVAVWLPRGWTPCEPPPRRRPEPPADADPAPAAKPVSSKKAAPSAGPDKSEGAV